MATTTRQLVADQLDTVREGYPVAMLVELTGKSETSVRKALKDMMADGDVVKDSGGNYRYTIVASSTTPAEELAAQVEETEAAEAEAADHVATGDEKPAKKKYAPRRENPPRPIRKNQKTGSELQVVPAGEVPDGFSTEDPTPPWYTLCHTHHTSVGSKKIMGAWAYSTNPEKFCGGCRDALKK